MALLRNRLLKKMETEMQAAGTLLFYAEEVLLIGGLNRKKKKRGKRGGKTIKVGRDVLNRNDELYYFCEGGNH